MYDCMNFADAEAVSHNIEENVCTAMSQLFRSSFKMLVIYV